jgi:hypothetical protein
MPKRVAAKKLTAENLRSIAASVSSSANKSRLKLLPRILREWERTRLQQYLLPDSPKTENIVSIKEAARQLLDTLKGLDKVEWLDLKVHLIRERHTEDTSRQEFQNVDEILNATKFALSKLALLRPEHLKRGPGRPRNIVGYLILQDAAAIFEWLHGDAPDKRASRRINRHTGRLEGPFHNFASTLWVGVYESDARYSTALTNWASWQRREGRSVFMVNLALRRPSWRIFDR